MGSAKRRFLSFSVKVLRLLNLWPRADDYIDDTWRLTKDCSLIVSLMPCALPILADFVFQLYAPDDTYNVQGLTENFIALNCIAGMIYMTICFIQKRRLIKNLVVNLNQFEEYGDTEGIAQTDKKANLLAKLFISYGIIGNIVYMTMPYLNIDECRQNKEKQTVDDGVPCGMVTRCKMPFKFDESPLFEIVFWHQFYTCTMVTLVILDLTMLLCGLLMHVTNQLSNLRRFLKQLDDFPTDKVMNGLHYCIVYHIDVIKFSEAINEAFSTMMMLHLTLTSLVISGLGFMVLIVDNFFDALRFSLHLVGWLCILLLVCSHGQFLVDESISVAEDIYSFLWFQAPLEAQKRVFMILMRSQKPLTLSAAGMGHMELPTFLSVLSSAYSYFTLLLNIKP